MHDNIKIGLFAGYRQIKIGGLESYWINLQTNKTLGSGALAFKPLPDFFTDLNALHLAETYLSNNQRQKYHQKLIDKVGIENILFLTAQEKAETLIEIIS